MDYASIAKATHLSSKTVKRRLDRMIKEYAVFVAPKFDFVSLRGTIPADIFMKFEDSKWTREVDESVFAAIGSAVAYSTAGSPEYFYALTFLDNVEQASRIASSLKDIEGVKEAYVDLIEEHWAQYSVLTKNVERLASLSRVAVANPKRR